MSDDFQPLGGNPNAPAVTWFPITNPSTTFTPFPYSGQPATPEIGYGEGGYGQGGYDAPAVPASLAPIVNWMSVTTK